MASSLSRLAQLSGAILGFTGVALGAFAAHALKSHLSGLNTTDIWRTAVLYQDIHAVALLAVAPSAALGRGMIWCWIAGVASFSGSLYGLAFNPAWHVLGPVTPLGGLLLLVGWGWFIVRLLKTP